MCDQIISWNWSHCGSIKINLDQFRSLQIKLDQFFSIVRMMTTKRPFKTTFFGTPINQSNTLDWNWQKCTLWECFHWSQYRQRRNWEYLNYPSSGSQSVSQRCLSSPSKLLKTTTYPRTLSFRLGSLELQRTMASKPSSTRLKDQCRSLLIFIELNGKELIYIDWQWSELIFTCIVPHFGQLQPHWLALGIDPPGPVSCVWCVWRIWDTYD